MAIKNVFRRSIGELSKQQTEEEQPTTKERVMNYGYFLGGAVLLQSLNGGLPEVFRQVFNRGHIEPITTQVVQNIRNYVLPENRKMPK